MVRLDRTEPPPQLLRAAKRLTRDFIDSGGTKPVWNRVYIKKALLSMSSSKCAYCECRLAVESKYLEVEHFWCKSKPEYRDRVVEWENLLPACKGCNGSKGNYDVGIAPIINPTIDLPQDHLYLANYRIMPKTALGKLTRDILGLNDKRRLCWPRFDIGNACQESLEKLCDHLGSPPAKPKDEQRWRRKSTAWLRDLLESAQASEEYAALTATVLLEDPAFAVCKQKLQGLGLWTAALEELESGAQRIKLVKARSEEEVDTNAVSVSSEN